MVNFMKGKQAFMQVGVVSITFLLSMNYSKAIGKKLRKYLHFFLIFKKHTTRFSIMACDLSYGIWE